MIKFLNDSVRGEFHLLPLDRQKEFTDSAEHFAEKGMTLTILHVDRISDNSSEIIIRVDKEIG